MVKLTYSGIVNFRGVTGGVYKARKQVHRCIADQRLLAIPTSCKRVAAYNLNLDKVYEISWFSRIRNSLS